MDKLNNLNQKHIIVFDHFIDIVSAFITEI